VILSSAPRDSSSFSLVNAGADFGFPNRDSLVNEGTGRNYGVEFTAERFLRDGWYALGTVSLFDSKYTASDDVMRSTAFDAGWLVNFLGGKEWNIGNEGRTRLGFDTKVTIGGGNRYTPIDLQASIAADEEIRLEDQAFSEQFDNYFRMDFKIRYVRESKNITQQFSIDLQNVTGNQNVFSQQYNRLTQDFTTRYQLGFFPDIQYRILF
jgi:hypothetical protein